MLNNNRQIEIYQQKTLAVGNDETFDFTNTDGKGLALDSLHTGSGTVQFTVQEIVPGTNEPVQIHQTGALAAGANRVVIYPGVPTATNMVNNVVGRKLRIVTTVGTAAVVLSMGVCLIP